MTTAIIDRVVLVQKQYRKLMQQMALYFGRTYVPRFGRVFENHPKILTRHPYLNYLRHYKIRHPKLGFNRMLQSGARAWKQLTPKEKSMYSQKEILRQYRQRDVRPNTRRVFRRSNKPMTFQRRTMNACRNARNSWRHQLPKRRTTTRNAVRKQIWQI